MKSWRTESRVGATWAIAPEPIALAFRGELDDRTHKISALLHEAAETHHVVYRITDGDDPDWASWYADWLVDHSELPDLLDVAPVRSELVYMLVRLDKKYTMESPEEKFEDYYARGLLEHFRRT